MDLLHTHTQCCLGQDLFTNMYHVALSDDLDIQHCSLTNGKYFIFFSYRSNLLIG